MQACRNLTIDTAKRPARPRPALFTHRIAAHLDAMGIVNEAVQDAVGGRGITDLFVPARNRKLRSQNRRARLISVFADFPEVAPLGFRQRSHGPVIDHQHIDAAQARQQVAQTAVGAGDRQIAKQRCRARLQRRASITAAFRQRPVQSHGFGALQVLVDGARRDRAASPNLLMAQSKFITEAKDLIFRMDSLLAGKRILPFPGEVCPPL